VQPQFATQYALGYFRNFKENIYETSVEVYYKDMQHQIEYAPGALPENTINDNVDNNFVFGKGWSYGAEFFVKKQRDGSMDGLAIRWHGRNGNSMRLIMAKVIMRSTTEGTMYLSCSFMKLTNVGRLVPHGCTQREI